MHFKVPKVLTRQVQDRVNQLLTQKEGRRTWSYTIPQAPGMPNPQASTSQPSLLTVTSAPGGSPQPPRGSAHVKTILPAQAQLQLPPQRSNSMQAVKRSITPSSLGSSMAALTALNTLQGGQQPAAGTGKERPSVSKRIALSSGLAKQPT